MGYESRVFAIERFTDKHGNAYGIEIACFDVFYWPYSQMTIEQENADGPFWTDVFNRPIDYDIYVNGAARRCNAYGDALRCADVHSVIEYLEKYDGDDYRPYAFLEWLRRIVNTEMFTVTDLQLVEYGY